MLYFFKIKRWLAKGNFDLLKLNMQINRDNQQQIKEFYRDNFLTFISKMIFAYTAQHLWNPYQQADKSATKQSRPRRYLL